MSNDFKSGFKKLSKGRQIFLGLTGGIVVIFLVLLIFGVIVQFLWNSTMGAIFDLSPISYWQAIGLLILAKLFFGFGSSSNQSKSKKKKKEKSSDIPQGTPSAPGFESYWQAEGKDAWEAFQASKGETSDQPGENG